MTAILAGLLASTRQNLPDGAEAGPFNVPVVEFENRLGYCYEADSSIAAPSCSSARSIWSLVMTAGGAISR